MEKKNVIKVQAIAQGIELNVSTPNTKQVISATNNRAQYFAELAKKYRDEALQHRDNAKFYAEQNSDVTYEYINNVRASLENKISTKQDKDDYALRKEIPKLLSEFENDTNYVNEIVMNEMINEVRLPEQVGNEGKVLMTDGKIENWVAISTFDLFDTKISDHILEGEEAKGWALQGTYLTGALYLDFYAKCLEQYNEATATETVNSVTVKVHPNGHKFYDLTDKDNIDNFYNSTGSAWFYGVDVENERIFLPRDKYFAIKGSASVIGNGKALGFTDGTNTKYTYAARSGNNAWAAQPSFFNSAQGNVGETTNNSCEFFSDYKYIGISADPTKSGLEAQLLVNEDKYLYICVGNTVVNSADINAGALVAQMEQKANISLDNISPSQNFRTMTLSWAMPDYTAGINITSLPYTAPKDGLISIIGRIGNGTLVLKLNNTPMTVVDSTATGVFARDIRVKKGDVLDKLYGNGTAPYNDSSRNEYSMFYPLKGAD